MDLRADTAFMPSLIILDLPYEPSDPRITTTSDDQETLLVGGLPTLSGSHHPGMRSKWNLWKNRRAPCPFRLTRRDSSTELKPKLWLDSGWREAAITHCRRPPRRYYRQSHDDCSRVTEATCSEIPPDTTTRISRHGKHASSPCRCMPYHPAYAPSRDVLHSASCTPSCERQKWHDSGAEMSSRSGSKTQDVIAVKVIDSIA
ncbi:hypothetical protein F5883DRAFT_147516 [Diaporthe sp. PMI_573]|nr:hypothetical protein F5883DRAFT_147516 [Diaporthaceae sp. PMI_573]